MLTVARQAIAAFALRGERFHKDYWHIIVLLRPTHSFPLRQLSLPAPFDLEYLADCPADLQEMAATVSGCHEGQTNRHAVVSLEAWDIQHRSV
jgi:hypothetical protein